MDELDALKSRLEKALSRLERAVADGATAGAGSDASLQEARARISALETEKADLEQRLARLNAEREKDIAHLDSLIARLRPLVEEGA